jgi:two-component system, chemotaxis family, response regulator Rcp1
MLKPVKILLVEDNPGDILLTKKAFSKSKIKNNLYVTKDGVEALKFLKEKTIIPDIILLDINLPKKNGWEVLHEIKNDEDLKSIPVIMLTTSESDVDILKSYNLYANSYLVKPVKMEEFINLVKNFTEYWFCIVKLPSQGE